MKKLLLIILSATSLFVHGDALVFPTPTKIDVSGVIGEKGTIETLPYRIVSELADNTSFFPDNKQKTKNKKY